MELATYKFFYERDHANALAEILKENGIACLVIEEKENLDSLFGGSKFKHTYSLKIRREDFQTASDILLNRTEKYLNEIDKDHYLLTFKNEELYDVLAKQDEWSESDFILAQRILKDRGETVDDNKINKLKSEAIRELNKPEDNRAGIQSVYVFVILVCLIGILISWYYSKTENAILISIGIVGLFYVFHLDYVERRALKTCPKCGNWRQIKKIGRLDRTDILLPNGIGTNVPVVYKFQCHNCSHRWEVLAYEEGSYS